MPAHRQHIASTCKKVALFDDSDWMVAPGGDHPLYGRTIVLRMTDGSGLTAEPCLLCALAECAGFGHPPNFPLSEFLCPTPASAQIGRARIGPHFPAGFQDAGRRNMHAHLHTAGFRRKQTCLRLYVELPSALPSVIDETWLRLHACTVVQRASLQRIDAEPRVRPHR